MISSDPRLPLIEAGDSEPVLGRWLHKFYERLYRLYRDLAQDLINRGAFETDKDYSASITWTASVNPAIGNGTLMASYELRGKFCRVSIQLVPGTTTTFGTGTWIFSLPFLAARTSIGNALCIDTGVASYVGVASVGAGSSSLVVITNSGNVSSTVPFTWGAADQLYIDLEYRING